MHLLYFADVLANWLFAHDDKSDPRALVPGLEANQGALNVVGVVLAGVAIWVSLKAARDDRRRADAAETRAREAERKADQLRRWADHARLQNFAQIVQTVTESVFGQLLRLQTDIQRSVPPHETLERTRRAAADAALAMDAMRHTLPHDGRVFLVFHETLRIVNQCADPAHLDPAHPEFAQRVQRTSFDLRRRASTLAKTPEKEAERLREVERQLAKIEAAAVTPPPLPWWRRAWRRPSRSAERSTP